MKKRMLSLALALCMLCALLTACGEPAKEKTTAEILSEALEKTEALNDFAAKMDVEMNMSASGFTMSIPMKIDAKVKDIKGENPVIYAMTSMSMFGQNIEVEMYQEGEWSYVVMGDMKYKTKSAEGADVTDNTEDMLKELPDALLEGVALEQNEDGSQTVSVSIPADQFTGIYEDFIEGLNTGSEIDISTVKIADAVVKITIAKGYITVYDMSFKMDMDVEGTMTNTEVKASITYDNPGEPVEITPPEGYKDFEEQGIEE